MLRWLTAYVGPDDQVLVRTRFHGRRPQRPPAFPKANPVGLLSLALLVAVSGTSAAGLPSSQSLVGAEARIRAAILPILPARGTILSVDSSAVLLETDRGYARGLRKMGFPVHAISFPDTGELGDLDRLREIASAKQGSALLELAPGRWQLALRACET